MAPNKKFPTRKAHTKGKRPPGVPAEMAPAVEDATSSEVEASPVIQSTLQDSQTPNMKAPSKKFPTTRKDPIKGKRPQGFPVRMPPAVEDATSEEEASSAVLQEMLETSFEGQYNFCYGFLDISILIYNYYVYSVNFE